MIKIKHTDKLSNNASSLFVSYTRGVQISCGNYPYVEDLNNFIITIKNSLLESEYCATNVLGGKTSWTLFNEDPLFLKFLTWFVNKHQSSNPWLQFFSERRHIQNSWGNELKKGHWVNIHEHNEHHGILYLTEGSPLILPELDDEITPQPGDYYFFPPLIKHYVDVIQEDGPPRYCVVFNLVEKQNWAKRQEINKLNGDFVK